MTIHTDSTLDLKIENARLADSTALQTIGIRNGTIIEVAASISAAAIETFDARTQRP